MNFDRQADDPLPMEGMREAQRIRSKIKGHVGGSEANQIIQAVTTSYESFKDHFSQLCARIAVEMEAVELHFGEDTSV